MRSLEVPLKIDPIRSQNGWILETIFANLFCRCLAVPVRPLLPTPLKKVLLEADPTPSMSQRVSGKEIPRKEPQNEGLLENDLYLLTQGDDAGQDFGGIPEAGG